MFSSSSNNGYSPFHPFLNNQTIMQENDLQPSPTSSTEKPGPINQGFHSSPTFLHYRPNDSFLDHKNQFLMTHLLLREEFLGSCSNLGESSSGTNEAVKQESKKAKSIADNDSCKKKKKKRSAGSGDGATAKQAVPRKRSSGKKDRHSKIYTAQGPRDRRMRLSLQIARKFFDLQDMLGFDKASKTIEWLFSKSRTSIKELKESMMKAKRSSYVCSHKDAPSQSDNKDIGIDKVGEHNEDFHIKGVMGHGDAVSYKQSQKSGEIHHVLRKSRDKARARARERTMEKMKMRGFDTSEQNLERQETNPNGFKQLISSSSPIKAYDENFGSCSLERSPIKMIADEDAEDEDEGQELCNMNSLEHQMDSVTIIEKFLGITSSSRSSAIYDYLNNFGDFVMEAASAEYYSEFNGNWDSNNCDGHSEDSIPEMKGSTGNVPVKTPNDISLTNPTASGQNATSLSMNNLNIGRANSRLPSMNHSDAYESNLWSNVFNDYHKY